MDTAQLTVKQSFVNMIAAESFVKKHHPTMTVVCLVPEKSHAHEPWPECIPPIPIEQSTLTRAHSGSAPSMSTGPLITHAASHKRILPWPGIVIMVQD